MNDLKSFLNRPGISMSGLIKEAKVGRSTLYRILNGQDVTERVKSKLLPVLKSYGFTGTLIILMIFSGCGQKQWMKRGLKKGWIDTTKTISTTEIQITHDTVYLDSIHEVVLTKIDSVFLSDTIVLKPETRYKIKEIIKTHYVPKERPFMPFQHQTETGTIVSVWPDGNGNVKISVTEKQTQVIIKRKWYQYWWLLLVGAFIGMVFGLWVRK